MGLKQTKAKNVKNRDVIKLETKFLQKSKYTYRKPEKFNEKYLKEVQ